MQESTLKRVWGGAVEGCRISIAADKAEIQPGQPVHLFVFLRNDGTVTIHSPRVSDWFDYEYAILGPVGMPPPMTEFGAKLWKSRQEQVSGTLLDLKPGEELPSTVELTKLFEFKEIGFYSITISKMLMHPRGDFFRVGSNQITVRVKQ